MPQGNSVFKYLKHCQTAFHGSCIFWIQVSTVPIPSSIVVLSFIFYIIVGIKRYCLVVLIYNSVLTVMYLFMFLLAIYTSSLEKCLFKSFAHFKVKLFVFSLLNCECSYISWIQTLTDIWFANIFSHSVTFLNFLMVPFDVQKFSMLVESWFVWFFSLYSFFF